MALEQCVDEGLLLLDGVIRLSKLSHDRRLGPKKAKENERNYDATHTKLGDEQLDRIEGCALSQSHRRTTGVGSGWVVVVVVGSGSVVVVVDAGSPGGPCGPAGPGSP